MIEQFEVNNYKGLKDFSLGPMRRVNLVTGPNGVGKSSLTEALWLFHGRYNPAILWSLYVQRRGPVQDLSPLTLLGGSHPITLRGFEGGKWYGVKFNYEESGPPLQRRENGSPQPRSRNVMEELGSGLADASLGVLEGLFPFPIVGRIQAEYSREEQDEFHYDSEVILGPTGPGLARTLQRTGRPTGIIVNRDAPFPVESDRVEKFSDVVARGEKQRLLDILRLIRPHIKDIQILSHQGTPSLWADAGETELLPIEAMGGGVVRLLGLLVNFFIAKGGLIIIDEIENGFHHSALKELWQQIQRISSLLDVQCFITTHSLECVNAAITALNGGQERSDFVIHQMYQTDSGDRRSQTYADDKLTAAMELGLDVR